jgi:hypothetical protein
MKKFIVPLVLSFLTICSCSKSVKEFIPPDESITQTKKTFFHDGDSIIDLHINFQMVCIQFKKNEYSATNALNLLKTFPEIDLKKTTIAEYYIIFAILKKGITENDYLSLLINLNSNSSMDYATPCFFGDKLVFYQFLTNKFFLLPARSDSSFQDYLVRNIARFQDVENYRWGNLFMVNKIVDGFEAMDISNEIYERGGIDYAQPSMLSIGNFLSK